MKTTSKLLKCIVATFVVAIMALSVSAVAFAAETETRTVETVIASINAEYGTNIHPLSNEELEKYGLPQNSNKTMEEADLDALETQLRYIAEVEIPRFKQATQEAMEKERQKIIDEIDVSDNLKNDPVTATKAIDYAIAGATAYITTNNYGARIWGAIVNKFCYTNMYQPIWFMSLNPSVSKIDGGRTLYWKGTGDYCAYINGTQYYLYSGTQYAEMYVGNYS